MEIKFPDKSDNDLAVEALFGAAHGTNPEMWKAAMGGRYEGVKEEIDRLLRNNSNFSLRYSSTLSTMVTTG